ncbi:MAG: hypothetical protein LBL59_08270 [Xanthomonadaceae bacterium]|jgi:hypothetical protein|nr:hypothetical protein [Xanthomonadaceae bacterium]
MNKESEQRLSLRENTDDEEDRSQSCVGWNRYLLRYADGKRVLTEVSRLR